VTSKGDNVDFVSRFFTPQATLLEDPVTGSAHCSLIPFWANRLQKKKMNALQLSERGGQLDCEAIGDRVRIGGRAKTYMQGHFFLDV
jgi:predicted PhzF superfamily epimerase YddE/YHI9